MPDSGGGKIVVLEAVTNVWRSITFTNVLILALLLALLLPAYFAYDFISNPEFRREFSSHISIDHSYDVPCTVYSFNLPGEQRRNDVAYIYEIDGRYSYAILVRAPAAMNEDQINRYCLIAQEHAKLLRQGLMTGGQSK